MLRSFFQIPRRYVIVSSRPAPTGTGVTPGNHDIFVFTQSPHDIFVFAQSAHDTFVFTVCEHFIDIWTS